jgi:hypothetical protein
MAGEQSDHEFTISLQSPFSPAIAHRESDNFEKQAHFFCQVVSQQTSECTNVASVNKTP